MADDTNTAEREAAEQWLRDRYGAYRGHFAWRELEEAFLAGRASLAPSAGSEPVALDPRHIRKFLQALQAGEMSVARAVEILDAWVEGRYSDDMVPPPPADSCLIADDEFPMEIVRKLRSEMAPHPSPPEGMTGWMQGVEAVAAMLTKKADDFAKEHGHDDMGGLSFGRGAHADAKLDYHSGLLELADEVREMRSEATPELSSGNRVLMEHSGCGRGTQIDTLTVRMNPGDKVILCPGPVTRASITAPPLPASEAKEL